jgi:hypothetical protein
VIGDRDPPDQHGQLNLGESLTCRLAHPADLLGHDRVGVGAIPPAFKDWAMIPTMPACWAASPSMRLLPPPTWTGGCGRWIGFGQPSMSLIV